MEISNIIRTYADAKPDMKINIICRFYPQSDGIIDARSASMKYIIWEELERKRNASYGDLGVRVQGGHDYNDPTSNESVFLADLESAIRNCNFSADFLVNIEHSEWIIAEAHILNEMKALRNLYDLQIACLRVADRTLYQRYLNHEMSITDIATHYQIAYPSAVKKISRIRKCVQNGLIEILKKTSCQHGTE